MKKLLFRGVVYGGYRKSFGPIWAAVLTTFIFVLLQFTEIFYAPTGTAGITGLALMALWFRLRWNAIGPTIADHIGNKAVVSALAIYWSNVVE